MTKHKPSNLKPITNLKPLLDILKPLKKYQLFGEKERNITAICFDSRKIVAYPEEEGTDLYVAQRGTQTDGHRFIGQVIENGCRVIVCARTFRCRTAWRRLAT